jgi:hypothetical protein
MLDENSIGDIGLICKKCGKDFDVSTAKGEWVSTYSNTKDKPTLEGYRVCLLHFAKAP